MDNLLRVGVISSTHGLKGEVKVFPTTNDSNRFKTLKKVIMETGKEQMELDIESVKFFKQFAILKFRGIDHINEIEKYKGRELFVTRDMAVKLKKDEYYIADLIGMQVILEDGSVLGKLTDVLETGANDVYIIAREEKQELLIPAIKDCIRSVDIEQKLMTVHLLDGLEDE